MATLDVVANGRLTLMVALGWQPKARAAYGMPWKERVPRFEEALRILRLLFAKDAVDYRGRFCGFEGVSFHPKPVHGRIPLWIGAGAEPAIRHAACRDDALIIGPLGSLETVEAQMRDYRRRYRSMAGRGPSTSFLCGGMYSSPRIGQQRSSSSSRSSKRTIVVHWKSGRCPDCRRPPELQRETRAVTSGGDLAWADTLRHADPRAHSACYSDYR
jgi:hypothetical protein